MTSAPHVVVASTRRAWSPEQKRAILAEADVPGMTASAVARRHGLHPLPCCMNGQSRAYIIRLRLQTVDKMSEKFMIGMICNLPRLNAQARRAFRYCRAQQRQHTLNRANRSLRIMEQNVKSRYNSSTIEGAVLARIHEVFMETLQIAYLDPDVDFFELGGDSLLLLRIFFKLQEEWRIEMDLSYIYAHPITVRFFAQVIIKSLNSS